MDCDKLGEVIVQLEDMHIDRKKRIKGKNSRKRENAKGFNNGLNVAVNLLKGGDDDGLCEP